MNSEAKSLPSTSISVQVCLGICALAMIGLSIYLTQHYFEVRFSTNLSSGTVLCDINSFFNCDHSSLSPFSNIWGVPISLFGLLIGVFILTGFIFSSKEVEGTNFAVLGLNAIGCLALLAISLIWVGGLCPMCFLYYCFSIGAFFIFWKFSSIRTPSLKVLVIYAVCFIITAAIAKAVVAGKEERNSLVSKDLIRQFSELPNLGLPSFESAYRLASATPKFADAPLRITKFSDFQCPACKSLSKTLHKLANRYQGKINIQYFFYPLDHHCNPGMERPLHQQACRAAYLAVCLPKKFLSVHDDLFENQDKLSLKWINDYAKKEGVSECLSATATKEMVSKMLKEAEPFNIRSTPTILLNGKKIEGGRPAIQMQMIMDEILRNQKK